MKSTTTPSTMRQHSRTPIAIFLLALGLLALLYNLFLTFPSLSSSLKMTLRNALPQGNFCTKDVGEGVCCDLYMEAEPCVEECMVRFVNRETFVATLEFDGCEEQCLARYTRECGSDGIRREDALGR